MRAASLHLGNSRKNDRLPRESMRLLPIVNRVRAKMGAEKIYEATLNSSDPSYHRYHAASHMSVNLSWLFRASNVAR